MNWNWNLIAGLNWRDWRPLREPILWLTFLGSVAFWVAEGLGGGYDWGDVLEQIGIVVLAMFGRAQVSPPLPPA